MKSLILLVMTQMVTCEIPRSKAISVSLLRFYEWRFSTWEMSSDFDKSRKEITFGKGKS